MYSEEKYEALRAVCVSYKNDYDKAFERLKSQQREIDTLRKENEMLKNQLDEATERAETAEETLCRQNSPVYNRAWSDYEKKIAVKEFVEKLKGKCHNYYPSIDHYCCSEKAVSVKDIDELLKEYVK